MISTNGVYLFSYVFARHLLGGMRGYEAVWTDLGPLRYDASHCLDHEDESVVA